LRGEPLINSFDGNLIKCGRGEKEAENDEEKDDGEEFENNNSNCPNTHYCHIGNSIEESGCCLKSGNSLFLILK